MITADDGFSLSCSYTILFRSQNVRFFLANPFLDRVVTRPAQKNELACLSSIKQKMGPLTFFVSKKDLEFRIGQYFPGKFGILPLNKLGTNEQTKDHQ